ncbi:MAG: hypothetical protein RR232_03650 [Clostridia bacterium]
MGKTKVIAIEGIDGSGKSVQFAMLHDALCARGLDVATREYPCYESFFGRQVGKLLSSADGVSASEVDGKSMALWFALDRFEDFKDYHDGDADVLIINRFVLSNAVYQSIRDIDLGKPEIVDWVFELEYGHFGLPRPDAIIFYDVDTRQAQTNITQKGFREYVGDRKDVYEASRGIQQRARDKYLECAARYREIIVVPCMKAGAFLAVEAIAAATLDALYARGII